MSDTLKNTWFIILNPNAGKRAGEKAWVEIKTMLEESSLSFVIKFTSSKLDATIFTQEAIKQGYRKIISAGGDGTLNEVVNGIMGQSEVPYNELTVAMIPIGTGNDWCRTFKISTDYIEAVKSISNGKMVAQDVGVVNYIDYEGNSGIHYFANVAGIGFDAVVAQKVNRQKAKGKTSKLSYLYNLFTGLIGYRPINIKVLVNGKEIKTKILSIGVGIGQYNGGGMKQLPYAEPNDGLLDMTIVHNKNKFAAISNIKKLYDGSIIELDWVDVYKSKEIEVFPEGKMLIEVDGESIGQGPFKFTIVDDAINVIVGNDFRV